MKRFLLLLFTSFVFFISPSAPAMAQDVQQRINSYKPTLNVQLGGFGGEGVDFTPINCTKGECNITWLSQYIDVLYRYGMGIAAFLAVIMVMVGGFLWLMSAGSPDRVSQGKEFITAAISGLVIALFSFTILNFINPNLVNLRPLSVAIPNEISAPAVSATCCYCGANATAPVCSSGVLNEETCKQQESSGSAIGSALGIPGSEVECVFYNSACNVVRGCSQYSPEADRLNQAGVTVVEGVDAATISRGTRQMLQTNYGRFHPQVTSTIRDDDTRHDPTQPGYVGNVLDIDYDSSGPLTDFITQNGRVEPLTWGTAYHMGDGSVWVKEPGGSEGYHWHVEFPANGWTWKPVR